MSTSSLLEEPECPTPNWLELPVEVTMMILGELGPIEILEVAQRVCMTWRRACKDPSMWRSIRMWVPVYFALNNYDMMWRHAIDRSCGQLNDINVGFFISAELLRYILDWAPKLRRLQISRSRILNGLDEIGSRLPQLEELHLSLDRVSEEVLGSFGRCCPKLKSLTYNYVTYIDSYLPYADDKEALVIAETMPGLHHLSLNGNYMTNHGLQTILDRCPHLEFLDLTECRSIDLEGDFGRSCIERFNNLKPQKYTPDPNFGIYDDDSGDDYGYDQGHSPNLITEPNQTETMEIESNRLNFGLVWVKKLENHFKTFWFGLKN